jgi:hypothetical protein
LCDFFGLNKGKELSNARRGGNVNVVGHVAIHRHITVCGLRLDFRFWSTLTLWGRGVRVTRRGGHLGGRRGTPFLPPSLAVERGHLSRLEAAQKENGDDDDDIITHVRLGLRARYLERRLSTRSML